MHFEHLSHGKKKSVGKTRPTTTELAAWDRLSSRSFWNDRLESLSMDRLSACHWSFYILQVCHPERRLPESKDLAAAVFAAVICPGATTR